MATVRVRVHSGAHQAPDRTKEVPVRMSLKPEHVVELTEANFADVIGRSRQVPVLVDFWADWCAPCKQIGPVLEKLAAEYGGRFILAKVNADREPVITQQFGVRGLPTLKIVFQGQLAGELVGAHPEAAIRKFLEPFAGAAAGEPEDAAAEPDFHAQVLDAVQSGRVGEAIAALGEQLAADKEDHKSRSLLVELLLQEDRVAEAQAVLDAVPGVIAELRRPRALVAFARRADGIPGLAELESRLGASPATETRYHYALRLVMANRAEEGLELLLEILRADRAYGEDAARKALLEIFEMLGREDPLTARYRRRLATFLY